MGDSGQVRPPIVLQSTITCPRCGAKKTETMPTDACVFIYECGACGGHFAPKRGHCCVFCSYGTVQCPPVQESSASRNEAVGGLGGAHD
jgi:hypothetical protein